MTYGRRLIFACIVFSLSAPAGLLAAPDITVPAATSFAYRYRHSVTPLPAAAIARVAPRPGEEIGDEATFNVPLELPTNINLAPMRQLTRNSMCDAIVSAARANDLPVSFFANLIWQESNFDTVSISSAGAQGVAQFMPRTAFEFGLMNPFEPIHALFTAGEFLRRLNGQFGNLGLAAAAYNAGPRRIIEWLGKRGALPGETRNYVHRITGRSADQWTPGVIERGPATQLMPARAPCYAVVEEVEAQTKLVRVSQLMKELTAATAPPSVDQNGKPFDEVAWTRATTQPGWQQWAVAMAGSAVKRIQDKETREASAERVLKLRAWTKIAAVTLKKAAVELAKPDDPVVVAEYESSTKPTYRVAVVETAKPDAATKQGVATKTAKQGAAPKLAKQAAPVAAAKPAAVTKIVKQNQAQKLAKQAPPAATAKPAAATKLAKQNVPAKLAKKDAPAQIAKKDAATKVASAKIQDRVASNPATSPARRAHVASAR